MEISKNDSNFLQEAYEELKELFEELKSISSPKYFENLVKKFDIEVLHLDGIPINHPALHFSKDEKKEIKIVHLKKFLIKEIEKMYKLKVQKKFKIKGIDRTKYDITIQDMENSDSKRFKICWSIGTQRGKIFGTYEMNVVVQFDETKHVIYIPVADFYKYAEIITPVVELNKKIRENLKKNI